MQQEAKDQSRLLTIGEAARRLGIAPRTLTGWITTGRGQAVRLGPRTTRIRESEVQRLIEEGSR